MRAFLLGLALLSALSTLTGCAVLESFKGMVFVLVLVPVAILFGLIFILSRRGKSAARRHDSTASSDRR